MNRAGQHGDAVLAIPRGGMDHSPLYALPA